MWLRAGIEHVCRTLRFAIIPVVHAEQPWIDGDFSVVDRLKIAVTPEEYEGLSNEMRSVVTISSNVLIGGTITGAVIHTLNHFTDFMKTNRPYDFKSHLDAKDALRNTLEHGAIRGSLAWGQRTFCASLVFALVWNFLPVIRNKIDWHEHVLAGVSGGAVAGILHSNPKPLGLTEIKPKDLQMYRRKFITKSTLTGLALGVGLAVASQLQPGRSQREARNWTQYRKDNKLEFIE